MKIIQITDLHIGRADELPFGVDVRANFHKILAAVQSVPHDLLMITGDLCYEDGERDIYNWIKALLQESQLNYLLIPGNHDDTDLMVEVFELQSQLKEEEELFYTSSGQQPAFALLNSGPGKVTDTCLTLLKGFLDQHSSAVCLFMHHPPLPMGVPYMDERHAMRECEPLLEILTAHPYPISIFTGHYHVEKSLRWQNIDVHVTPSCFFQIDWQQKDFAIDHHRIAYRHLSWNGKTLEHAVVYPDALQK